jgi:hypothetical protein
MNFFAEYYTEKFIDMPFKEFKQVSDHPKAIVDVL